MATSQQSPATGSGFSPIATGSRGSAQEEVIGSNLIYFPAYAYVADKKVELQSETYTIQVNDEVLMLPVLKPFCGQVMKALCTCGDGACSLHAVGLAFAFEGIGGTGSSRSRSGCCGYKLC